MQTRIVGDTTFYLYPPGTTIPYTHPGLAATRDVIDVMCESLDCDDCPLHHTTTDSCHSLFLRYFPSTIYTRTPHAK